MRAKDLDREARALASAPGHVCFPLTEDLHGCRTAVAVLNLRQLNYLPIGDVPKVGTPAAMTFLNLLGNSSGLRPLSFKILWCSQR